MELSKKNILSIIEKNKKKDFKIINLNVFGNEILFDIETSNPTLQSKKNIPNGTICTISYHGQQEGYRRPSAP